MTRARALKHVIRARAAKTGERYTTARRHILAMAAPRPSRPVAPLPPAPSLPTKGGVTDATSLEKTGHGLDHWFALLDRFGAVEKGHTAAARHLHDDHRVPSWYAQGITVAYERARGVRVLNQRCDGVFHVSASKVIAAGGATIIAAFVESRRRKRWIDRVDPDLASALTAAVTAKGSKGFVMRANGQARLRYEWSGTIVEVHVMPKAAGKASLVIEHSRLAAAESVEVRRAQWKAVLAAIASAIAG